MGKFDDPFDSINSALTGIGSDKYRDAVDSINKSLAETVRASRATYELAQKVNISAADVGKMALMEQSLAGQLGKLAKEATLTSRMEEFGKNLAVSETFFRMPIWEELERLRSAVASQATADISSDFLSAAKSLRSAWVDSRNPVESAYGLAGLLSVGRSLEGRPFDASISEMLRHELGDWRTLPAVAEKLLDDVAQRRDLYYEMGLNPRLTSFPSQSFGAVLRSAHISVSADPPIQKQPVSESNNTEVNPTASPQSELQEQGVEGAVEAPVAEDRPSLGMIKAYEVVYILERILRRFICVVMERECGSGWVKQQVPQDVYKEWRDRKEKAESAGEPVASLIEFAELGDYSKIICNGRNWKYFESVFQSKESVRESFNRLIPLRRVVAHNREMSNEDVLFLWVEAHRLCKAMGSPLTDLQGFSSLIFRMADGRLLPS